MGERIEFPRKLETLKLRTRRERVRLKADGGGDDGDDDNCPAVLSRQAPSLPVRHGSRQQTLYQAGARHSPAAGKLEPRHNNGGQLVLHHE